MGCLYALKIKTFVMVEHVRRFVGSMFITRYFCEWARMRKSDSMQTQSLFFFHVHRLSGDLWLRVVLSSGDLWWRSLQSGIAVHKMVYKHADAPSVNPVLMEESTNHRSTSSCTVSLRPSPLILSRFPPELQAIIFVSALPSFLSVGDLTRVSLTQVPLNVSHVCRSWRNLVLSTPELWTRIWFVYKKSVAFFGSSPKIRNMISAVRAFVKRSGNCGLYIR